MGYLSLTDADRAEMLAAIGVSSIDELFDHPIHLGIVRTFPLQTQVPTKLVIWGNRSQGVAREPLRSCGQRRSAAWISARARAALRLE